MVLHDSLKIMKHLTVFFIEKKLSLKNKLIFSITKIHICLLQ